MNTKHNHFMDGSYHTHCPRCKLNEAAPDLLVNLKYCMDFISGKSSTTEQDKDEVLKLGKAVIELAEKEGGL